MMFLRRTTQRLLQLPRWLQQCLPTSCALCGRVGDVALCQPCRRQYFALRPRRCVQCAMPIALAEKAIRCAACLTHRPAFDATIVAADYLAPADQLVLALKFGQRLTLAPLLAEMLGNAIDYEVTRGLPLPPLMTIVPLSKQRLRERGFNQALEIARPLAQRFQAQLEPHLLMRLRNTLAQASLPVDERKRNMQRAFAVPHGAINHIRGNHIGVIDDVITTGATLNDIATTLKRYGAQRVTNIVFARTISK